MLTSSKHTATKESQTFNLKRSPIESKNAFAWQQNKFNTSSFNFSQIPLQAKLKVNTPGDRYEQEADRIADRVVSMNDVGGIEKGKNSQIQKKSLSEEISSISRLTTQRKCSKCEDEETLHRKSLSSEPTTITSSLNSQLNATKGGGNSMDASTNQFMSSRFGIDFSHVNIHANDRAAKMSQSINAKAFTLGHDIYFNQGEFQPNSWQGKRLLAHELVHTVQQNGQIFKKHNYRNTIQRYIDATGTKGSATGKPFRISDDLTMAVKVGYPNHDFYAFAGKAATANSELTKVGSGIELIEKTENFKVSSGSKSKTLKKIVPKNTQNATSGDSMKISDDCGTSCSVVVGSKRRTALHRDALTGLNAKTSATTPSLMKAEIMEKLLKKWLTMSSTSADEKKKINDTLDEAKAKKAEIATALADYSAATTEADKESKLDVYWGKVDAYGNIMMSYYDRQTESKREEIDKYLKINKFAEPNVGQGYTMSSGGVNYPGKRTWNFHWGGVVMKSDDQVDKVTLENYAVDGDEENDLWDFAMYGTAAKKGQTFHEKHHDTKQHGDKPTTMTIEKQ